MTVKNGIFWVQKCFDWLLTFCQTNPVAAISILIGLIFCFLFLRLRRKVKAWEDIEEVLGDRLDELVASELKTCEGHMSSSREKLREASQLYGEASSIRGKLRKSARRLNLSVG